MFREMRRKQQQLPENECLEILNRATSGVLAVLGDDDYPYAVPLSYVYQDGKIWLHGARSGHKLDAIRRHPKVSFCVISQDQVIPEEYTTYYRSVISFGKARELTDETEIRRAITAIAKKYAPELSAETRDQAIAMSDKTLSILELEIEYMTGKEAIELTRQKKP